MYSEQDREVIERFKELTSMFFGDDHHPSFINTCYEISSSDKFKKVIANGRYHLKQYELSDASFDIAVNVSQIHWYWTLPLSEDSQDAKWNDEEYVNKLKDKTIDQCDNRLHLTSSSLVNYRSHVPIVFSMHVLINTCRGKLEKYLETTRSIKIEDKVDHYNYVSFSRMLSLCNSILSLIELFDFASAYSLLRTLIESLFTYLAICGNKEAIQEYYKFTEYSLLKEESGEIPDEVKEKYPDYCGFPSFLSYGWLLTLAKEKGANLKKLRFNFATVVDYCQNEGAKMEKYAWTAMYKQCCRYVHASPFDNKDMNIDFLNLCSYLSSSLTNISTQFIICFNGKIDIQDVVNDINRLKDETKTHNTIFEAYDKKIKS